MNNYRHAADALNTYLLNGTYEQDKGNCGLPLEFLKYMDYAWKREISNGNLINPTGQDIIENALYHILYAFGEDETDVRQWAEDFKHLPFAGYDSYGYNIPMEVYQQAVKVKYG